MRLDFLKKFFCRRPLRSALALLSVVLVMPRCAPVSADFDHSEQVRFIPGLPGDACNRENMGLLGGKLVTFDYGAVGFSVPRS